MGQGLQRVAARCGGLMARDARGAEATYGADGKRCGDVVVTVPKNFRYGGRRGLAAWLSEGDAPGQPWSGELYEFSTWGFCPHIRAGERVYVVCDGRLVGYAPLVSMDFDYETVVTLKWCGWPGKKMSRIGLIRGGGAVACTIDEPITGFRGWRYRWWSRELEKPLDLRPWLGSQ
jgi:hypothetical protein